jgi:hypothetical protein
MKNEDVEKWFPDAFHCTAAVALVILLKQQREDYRIVPRAV